MGRSVFFRRRVRGLQLSTRFFSFSTFATGFWIGIHYQRGGGGPSILAAIIEYLYDYGEIGGDTPPPTHTNTSSDVLSLVLNNQCSLLLGEESVCVCLCVKMHKNTFGYP